MLVARRVVDKVCPNHFASQKEMIRTMKNQDARLAKTWIGKS